MYKKQIPYEPVDGDQIMIFVQSDSEFKKIVEWIDSIHCKFSVGKCVAGNSILNGARRYLHLKEYNTILVDEVYLSVKKLSKLGSGWIQVGMFSQYILDHKNYVRVISSKPSLQTRRFNKKYPAF